MRGSHTGCDVSCQCACYADKRNDACSRLREVWASSSWQMTVRCHLNPYGRTPMATAAARLAISRALCSRHCSAATPACRFPGAGACLVLDNVMSCAPGMQPGSATCQHYQL